MHIEFTQADESHLPELHDLVNSAYRGESSKEGWTTEADLLDGQRIDKQGLRDLMEKPNSVVLIAEDEDAEQLLGCVHLSKENDACYLGMLTVAPQLQGQGIGKMMLEEAEALAQFWDCTKIFMTVISIRKELIDWYLSKGFHLTGQKKPFPYGDERFGIPKRPDLEFVILEKRL
jgi:N-acetylglutamate synthase-like GNAT family acetyltransferase